MFEKDCIEAYSQLLERAVDVNTWKQTLAAKQLKLRQEADLLLRTINRQVIDVTFVEKFLLPKSVRDKMAFAIIELSLDIDHLPRDRPITVRIDYLMKNEDLSLVVADMAEHYRSSFEEPHCANTSHRDSGKRRLLMAVSLVHTDPESIGIESYFKVTHMPRSQWSFSKRWLSEAALTAFTPTDKMGSNVTLVDLLSNRVTDNGFQIDVPLA